MGQVFLNKLGKAAYNCWLEIPKHYPDVMIHEFVIMPNHMHGIIEILPGPHHPPENRYHAFSKIVPRSLGCIVRGYKTGVTKFARSNNILHTVWHGRYHDHYIRNHIMLRNIRRYILNNPARWSEKYG